jgi:hypothetical protein
LIPAITCLALIVAWKEVQRCNSENSTFIPSSRTPDSKHPTQVWYGL